MSQGDKIIGIFDKYFPVGTYAWHEEYNYCRVIAIENNQRIIRAAKMNFEGLIYRTHTVEVAELCSLDEKMIDMIHGLSLDIPLELDENAN